MTNAPLISFYGDDFTGSTDVMESLEVNGVPTVLFTRTPTDSEMSAFPNVRAIGLAGESRSQSPEWMDKHLYPAFKWLLSLGARYCHYKVCSTFDSSPGVGSIGRAIEIGLDVFDQRATNLIVGAPQLRRYTMFGHLFAAYQDTAFRIDRHPVMRRHPATPMAESDLRLHLGSQTTLPVGCVDPDGLRKLAPLKILQDQLSKGSRIVLIDVYDKTSQLMAGELLEESFDLTGPFVAGSSGVEYALLSGWAHSGAITAPAETPVLGKVTQIAVVSGSCSPTTERQIRTALAAGFQGISVDFKSLANGQNVEAIEREALGQAEIALHDGLSPLIYTALGPETVQAAGHGDAAGRMLGRLLRSLMEKFPLERIAVAGGDTSSHALSELDVLALTLHCPILGTPGSPVCNAHPIAALRSFEIALKGGQVGRDNYFVWLRDGE